MGEWISVKDRLPELIHKKNLCGYRFESSDWVLGGCEDGIYAIVRYEMEKSGGYFVDEFGDVRKVVHWMPIPEMPA